MKSECPPAERPGGFLLGCRNSNAEGKDFGDHDTARDAGVGIDESVRRFVGVCLEDADAAGAIVLDLGASGEPDDAPGLERGEVLDVLGDRVALVRGRAACQHCGAGGAVEGEEVERGGTRHWALGTRKCSIASRKLGVRDSELGVRSQGVEEALSSLMLSELFLKSAGSCFFGSLGPRGIFHLMVP